MHSSTTASNIAFQSTLPTRGSEADTRPPRRGVRISIHAPHEGERCLPPNTLTVRPIFQSTLPTRGSDAYAQQHNGKQHCISIHAPHEGERGGYAPAETRGENFNPRSPRGGAMLTPEYIDRAPDISIHAPHEGERFASAMLK